MCVIIHKPKGVAITAEYLREAAKCNRDGFGIIYYDEVKKKVCTWKSAVYNIEEIVKNLVPMKEVEMVLHFRIKTHGSVKDENCHPFQVLSREKSGKDLWFVHNGMISGYTQQGDETDTMAFNRDYLRKVLRHKPDLILEDAFREGTGKIIGQGSKLCFMTDDGTVVKVNADRGIERDGMWFSNNSPFPVTYQAPRTHTYQNGSANSNTGGNTNVCNIQRSTHDSRKMLGAEVRIGDKVVIYNQDDTIVTEGTIKSFPFITQAAIEFIAESNFSVEKNFFLDTGDSVMAHPTKYFAVPESYNVNLTDQSDNLNMGKTVEQILNKDDATKFYVDQEVLATGNDVIALPGSKKNPESDATSDEGSPETYSPNPIKYKGVEIDTSLRIGGYFLDSAGEGYFNSYEGSDGFAISIQDVFDMNPEERVELFVDYPQIAYGMFSDLVEHFCIYTDDVADDGDLEMEDDVVSEYLRNNPTQQAVS